MSSTDNALLRCWRNDSAASEIFFDELIMQPEEIAESSDNAEASFSENRHVGFCFNSVHDVGTHPFADFLWRSNCNF